MGSLTSSDDCPTPPFKHSVPVYSLARAPLRRFSTKLAPILVNLCCQNTALKNPMLGFRADWTSFFSVEKSIVENQSHIISPILRRTWRTSRTIRSGDMKRVLQLLLVVLQVRIRAEEVFVGFHRIIGNGGPIERVIRPSNVPPGADREIQDSSFSQGLLQLQESIRIAQRDNKKIRAYGSKWSYNDLNYEVRERLHQDFIYLMCTCQKPHFLCYPSRYCRENTWWNRGTWPT